MVTAARSCDRVSLLYLLGHFHYARYFAWYTLEMLYFLHLKTKAQLLTCAFVCNHQVDVLFEQFDQQAVICTGKDGLRLIIFSPEIVGQLISHHYISEKL